jgi:hypothetical protein
MNSHPNLFKTPTVVASFCHVLKPNKYGKYSVNLIFNEEAMAYKCPQKGMTFLEWFLDFQKNTYGVKPNGELKYPAGRPFPIQEGDSMTSAKTGEVYAGYEGNMIILTTSNDEIPVYSADKTIVRDEGRVYSGVYVKAVIQAHQYNTYGGGISLICKGLQIVGDGPSFGEKVDVEGILEDESGLAAEFAKKFGGEKGKEVSLPKVGGDNPMFNKPQKGNAMFNKFMTPTKGEDNGL